MKYYSTNKTAPLADLKTAVTKGLAPDKGLYMPEQIVGFEPAFFAGFSELSLQEISYRVAQKFFGDDVEPEILRQIVYDTMQFDIPLEQVSDNIYSLELFHGPTLAFKDVGARFMARLLSYFIKNEGQGEVNVLVATSGDTGSAVANGFLGVDGIKVYVLYPKGLVSEIQEKQFTTLGRNITALEIDGTFDDCQRLVKQAFLDEDITGKLTLTSANSINVARFLPQSFYYFWAVALLYAKGIRNNIVCAVPSGNFGNITAGLFGKKMGLPIDRFVAANNRNDIFYQYLKSGVYEPRASVSTIANAMDVGDPSNFARVIDLYDDNFEALKNDVSAVWYNDNQIRETMKSCYSRNGYLLDPHGAIGFRALQESLKPGETGFFIETAHPAKFLSTVEDTLQASIAIPDKLQQFMKGEKKVVSLPSDFVSFKSYLIK